MKAYSWIWSIGVSPVVVAAFVAGVILLPISTVVAFSLTAACTPIVSGRLGPARGAARGWRKDGVGAQSVVAGASAAALLCLVALLGPIFVPTMIVVVLSSPWFLRWLRGRLRNRVRHRIEGRCLEALDDRALCLAWRRSTIALHEARTTPRRLEVARCRESYLDEMERRNRVGFHAWLESASCADADIERYVAGRRDEEAT